MDLDLKEEIEKIKETHGRLASELAILRATMLSCLLVVSKQPERLEIVADVLMKAADVYASTFFAHNVREVAKESDDGSNIVANLAFRLMELQRTTSKLLKEMKTILEETSVLELKQ